MAKKKTSRFLDLDTALEEVEPIEIKHAGKTYTLSGEVPSDVVLTYMRYMGDDGTIPNQAVEGLFGDLVGQEHLSEMRKNGLTYKQLEFLTTWLLKEYGVTASQTDDEDEAGGSPN